MLLRLQKYDTKIDYHPGAEMFLSDTLSRAYLPETGKVQNDIEAINMVSFLPISRERLDEIKQHTSSDETLEILKDVIQQGWPEDKTSLQGQVACYYSYRDEMSLQDGIIFRGQRAVIPMSLRSDMLKRIHSSHIGVEGCMRRARECLFWPGMSAAIKDFVSTCEVCHTFESKQQKEPLIQHEFPDRPWSKVASDLFQVNYTNYLITVDYASNFWEVDYLENTTSRTVIRKLKANFSRHGIPDILITDNGPQYSSDEFRRFAKQWEFDHKTSSPGYPQSNGKAENAVKTAKSIMKKAKAAGNDPYLAMLDFRNTPTQGMNTSPVQRLFSRRTKTLLPTSHPLLEPQTTMDSIEQNKTRQKVYYDKSAKPLTTLREGDTVRITPLGYEKEWKRATVTKQSGVRSYIVKRDDGTQLRRNRRHLRKVKELSADLRDCADPNQPEDLENRQPIVSDDSRTDVTDSVPIDSGNTVTPTDSLTSTDTHHDEPRQNTVYQPLTRQTITRSGRLVKANRYLTDNYTV